jgi:hypothetical protein
MDKILIHEIDNLDVQSLPSRNKGLYFLKAFQCSISRLLTLKESLGLAIQILPNIGQCLEA